MFKLICFSVLVLSILGQHSAHGYVHKSADTKQFSGKNCQKEYSETCLKLDIVSFIDKMSERREFQILPQLSVVREENNSNEAESARMMSEIVRSFPDDKDKRLDSYIFAKLSNFLQSHTLKIQLMDQESVAEARAAFTGRKKLGGKKGGMEALLAAGMMMKGTLMALAMGAVALLAGKALMTGMIALVLAAVAGLKSLASGGGKQTTYEIVAKPVYSSSHSHSSSHEDVHAHGGGGGGGGHGHSGYGGYGRSFDPVSPYSKPE